MLNGMTIQAIRTFSARWQANCFLIQKSGYPGAEVSFWIISYADEGIKTLKKIRKAYRDANIL